MGKKLHIVNGDSTKAILEQSAIEGEIIVWREMLSDGPISEAVFSDDFWQSRYDYFEREFQVTRLEYFDKTIKELLKAEFLEDVEELTMWFEYDLFCQVNLMALCSFLLENFRKDVQYKLVCVGRDENRKIWQTLSDYTPEEYLDLYEKRINMSSASFEYAQEAWKVYVKKDKKALQQFNFRKNKRFKYFDVAMKQELERFSDENGLNQIDRKLLELLNESVHTQNDILRGMLIWQRVETVYGFGDIQYLKRLENLSAYYEQNKDVLYLNDTGKKLLLN